MAFNVIEASKKITGKYKRYLKTMFDIADPDYKRIFEEKIEADKSFSRGPYLDVVDSFKRGKEVSELIDEGILNSDFKNIHDIYVKTLYSHQLDSLIKIKEGNNVIVSTGTGSGKTESFLIPIFNHLMDEKKENGKISSGVRALIIYPMNALANDQLKRLRNLLKDYSDITFGAYTGQTENRRDNALRLYKKLYGEDENPLVNELISREEMKKNPPHILITNYAMLEFLMLRPEDNVFFNGGYANKWKFIVLDEAHTYNGSTGIEVSMLLKRVVAELPSSNIQYILTSATLGNENSNREVVDFASRLCSSKFDVSNIIRAKRILLDESNRHLELDSQFYIGVAEKIQKGYGDKYIVDYISQKYSLESDKLDEVLYSLLIQDKTYWKVKKYLCEPKSILSICEYMNWEEVELISFVEVASIASYNGKKLFDSRYHMFIRATEGVFVTLPPHKNLYLNRENIVYDNKGNEFKAFEVVTCGYCHSLYLLGRIEKNYLIQKSNSDNGINDAFLIGDTINDEDGDHLLEEEKIGTEKWQICSRCGFVRKSNIRGSKPTCGHAESYFVNLVKVESKNDSHRITKCICCENVNRMGILRGFFSGQEASTSVIGTSLFEELPEYEYKIELNTTIEDDDFGMSESIETEKVTISKKAKQFIAFSDSRQAAAYFSSYFSRTFDTYLHGRLINDEIKKIGHDEYKPLNNFVKDLSSSFRKKEIHDFDDENPDYLKEAWKAMLGQMVDYNSRNGLVGLGLLELGVDKSVGIPTFKAINMTEAETEIVINYFLSNMYSDAAIFYPQAMTEDDIESFTNNGVENPYLEYGSNSKYIKSFLPKTDKTNKRMEYLKKIFKSKGANTNIEYISKFLDTCWNRILLAKGILKLDGSSYKVDTAKLTVKNTGKWYKCDKCNRLTFLNIENICPTYKCDGHLEKVDIRSLEENNHYYRMFNDLTDRPLRVVEHTAQLNKALAEDYQNKFIEKKIDVLSCSTTFEMGVDVGSLETVFMRNMPPMPSNYAQRAGRAGRSTKSAAYALTFCNKSNHDFNYFERPIDMIKGDIQPPHFKTDNEKICIRHVYSSALAFFWKKYPIYFSSAKRMMENNEGVCGYDCFKEYLFNKPEELKRYLEKTLSITLQNKFEIKTFGWVDKLFANNESNEQTQDDIMYPSLKKVYELYKYETGVLTNAIRDAQAANKPSDYLASRLKNYEDEDIISFLSKNGILPKYGFPVDTVELSVLGGKIGFKNEGKVGVELSRDLSVAISEYAPGCQVVANNKLYTSRYIKRMPSTSWKKYDYLICPSCKTINLKISHEDLELEQKQKKEMCKCNQCGAESSLIDVKTFIIPKFGFVTEGKEKKPTLIKPEKTFRTEASFESYTKKITEIKYRIGNNSVSLASIDDGNMVMLNTTNFYVCPYCGYGVEQGELKKEERPTGFNPLIKSHDAMSGKKCSETRLRKYSLGYRFETDVIRLRIDKKLSYDEAYSVLQALIIGSSEVLDVENGEIAGTLQYNDLDGFDNFSFILYDKTPGGAGHVKRINNEKIIKAIFKAVYDKANNCSCGGKSKEASCYSCLRTYQNQKNHDIIKRSYVIEYLKNLK